MQQRRLAAIMFTDIVGYTALMGSDEDRAFDMLKRNHTIHKILIKKYKGKLIKEIGDGTLASFSLASDAVRCAIEIQQEAKNQQIPLKIGIHEGEMVFAGVDVLGDGVNFASRLHETAGEGGIVVSASVYTDIKNKPGIDTEFLGEKIYKNVDEPQKVYRVYGEPLPEEKKQRQNHKENKKIKTTYIVSGLVLVVAVMFIISWEHWISLTLSPLTVNPAAKEKSIAVLPFINDSPDQENTYFINGIMDEILNNLQKIKDLRTISRTSVEPFRGDTKFTLLEKAKKMNVNYIVEGSGQKYGNKFVLRVQLIEAENEKHIWGHTYEQEIHETSDIFNIQIQIAQAIADELQSYITPEEKQLINKTPTASLTAYDFYQRGRDEYSNKSMDKAEYFYRQALKYDSGYAQGYTGLAMIYWQTHFNEDFLKEKFMDSVLVLCDVALSYDPQLSEAYTIKGGYYLENGNLEEALRNFDRAINLNPNDWMAYQSKGGIYIDNDLINYIQCYKKAISLNRGPELKDLLWMLRYGYFGAGFIEKARNIDTEILQVTGDSSTYYYNRGWDEFYLGNHLQSVHLLLKAYAIDSTNSDILQYLGKCYDFLGQYKESLKYYKKWIDQPGFNTETIVLANWQHIGFSFWQNGYKKEAEFYFNRQIANCENSIRLGRWYAGVYFSYFDLASVYVFQGESNKAYRNLEKLNQKPGMTFWMVSLLKTDPLFKNIRNEPEFQQIVRNAEAKYQAEHERVRKWLEDRGEL